MQQTKKVRVRELEPFPGKPRRFRVVNFNNIFTLWVGRILYVHELIRLEAQGVNIQVS